MNTPGNPYEQGTPNPAPESSNPYLNQRPAASAPDLDAAAPTLRTEEQQRLNRKALLFLGGILLLLMMLAALVLRGSGDRPSTTAATDEQVSIPTLQDNAEAPMPAPQQVPPPEPIAFEPTPAPLALEPAPDSMGAPPPPPGTYDAPPPPPRELTLLERRMGADAAPTAMQSPAQDPFALATAQTEAQLAAAGQARGDQGPAAAAAMRPSTATVLQKADTLLVRGTYLRCVLETRIVTDNEGFTSCILSEPVYSINGRRMLLPKGSKILGSYRGEANGPRIAVVWDRITTPTGLDVAMSSPGIDNLGGSGHPGHYTNHWPSKVASALLVSLISDAFKYAAAENGPRTTTITDGGTIVDSPFESNTARTMDRMANEIISKNLRRPATVTINQGSVVAVYVARDVDFSGVLARR